MKKGRQHIRETLCLSAVLLDFLPFSCWEDDELPGSTRLLTYVEGMFKLPKGHLNLVSKSALMRNIKPQLDDHLAKLPVQYTI